MIRTVPHCDDDSCDMGVLAIVCPYCSIEFGTTENWYEYTNYTNQPESLKWKCDNCKKEIVWRKNDK